MRVLLVYPSNPSYCVLDQDFSCCEPLGVEYVAAGLAPEHHAEIIDMRFEPDLEARLDRGFDVVGLAVPFTTSITRCNAIAARIAARLPRATLILGGHYPSTSLARLDLQHVDYVVTGEGVRVTRELVDALATKSEPHGIAGITTIVDGKPRFGRKQQDIEIESCPTPARHLLAEHRSRYFHAHYDPIALVRFSVGCPFNCTFCILWKMTDRKYITRSIESIVGELASIDSPNIYVVDDEAFIQVDRMAELADAIIGAGIRKRLHMYVRSDTIAQNPALFEKWAAAGLDSVLVGLESVFDDDLASYHKRISQPIARECVRILHANKIEIRANFIVKPDYTIDQFRRVRDTVEELEIDRPTFAVLTPFVGTETYDQLKDDIIVEDPELYDCYHAMTKTRLPVETFYREFAGLFRSAQRRDTDANTKVFYSGRGDAFESFVSKIEGSYRYYSSELRAAR